MLFTEPPFLFFFLPILLALYHVSGPRLKNLLLLVSSLLFYVWGEGKFVAVLLTSIALNYVVGLLLGWSRGRRSARPLLAAGVSANLAMLIFFKYGGFLAENTNSVLAVLGRPPVRVPNRHMPIGISFFVFQGISYLVDVYRGLVKPQRSFVLYAMYKALFPQLIAGPIVRYADVADQVKARTIDRAKFASGVRRFIIGLGKKMILANGASQSADLIFGLPVEELTLGLAWLGATCYAVQIYFDFSGYSDMAIGLGRMFGFEFMENFNYPYIARSLTEFWRRWHISLSTWFRDYLYIPLGGNRCRPSRVYLNLLIVFFLCGLWHGASWNFVAWGLLHGAFLVAERLGLGLLLERLWSPVRHAYALLVVVVGWVLFRADTMGQALAFLGSMFGVGGASAGARGLESYLDLRLVVVLAAASVASTPVVAFVMRRLGGDNRWPRAAAAWALSDAMLLLLFFASVALAAAGSYNPFIYFRF